MTININIIDSQHHQTRLIDPHIDYQLDFNQQVVTLVIAGKTQQATIIPANATLRLVYRFRIIDPFALIPQKSVIDVWFQNRWQKSTQLKPTNASSQAVAQNLTQKIRKWFK